MKGQVLFIIAVTICLGFFSCATSGRRGEVSEEVRYWGYGTGSSMIQALNDAKKMAVMDAVKEMIGAPSEAAHRDELNRIIYQEGRPGMFVPGEELSILSQTEAGGSWQVEILAVVDLPALEKVLRSNTIYGGKVAPGREFGSGSVGAVGTKPLKDYEEKVTEAAFEAYMESEGEEEPRTAEPLSAEEKSFIREYVDQMTYMVYFNEDSGEDPFLMKSGVGIANKALAEEGVYIIDLSQIESIKKDQEIAYEDETGKNISMIQWIAGKLNADVYIELDAVTSGESRGGKYYGQANVTLSVFDASTGVLLGSVPYNSPETFSTASDFDARNNALQSSIYRGMPMALNQAHVYMEKALERGIRYDLLVLNTPVPKMMSEFRRKMRKRVKSLKTASAAPEETVYQVYLIGSIEDLEELVYDVSESIPGFEGMERIYFRGRSITFNTGL